MTTIFLTGKDGQLGWELHRTLSTIGNVIAFDHSSLDLSDHKLLRETIQEVKPHIIVNAAAYTAVDQAEKEQEIAFAINATAPEIMTEEAKRIGAVLIHYSTDYVFDGTKESPYSEDDKSNPLNIYGKSKLLGEQAIQSSDTPHYIFRTSWVYSGRGNNFLLTILRLALERERLSIVDDQTGSPTWSRTIAEITGQILAQNIANNGSLYDAIQQKQGLYHLTSKGQVSWYDFAKMILEIFSKKNFSATSLADIFPIPTSDYPTPATRPMNSVLSTHKLEKTFGISCPDWQQALSLCMESVKL